MAAHRSKFNIEGRRKNVASLWRSGTRIIWLFLPNPVFFKHAYTQKHKFDTFDMQPLRPFQLLIDSIFVDRCVVKAEYVSLTVPTVQVSGLEYSGICLNGQGMNIIMVTLAVSDLMRKKYTLSKN